MKTISDSSSPLNNTQPLNRAAVKANSSQFAAGWGALLLAALFAGSAQAQPTITNLGVLSGGSYSYGSAISANGLAVTGISGSSSGQRAFRWTAAGGMQNLGTLAGFAVSSSAAALSADGAVVTGQSTAFGGNVSRAFRWTAATGMQNLGVLGTGSASGGNAISANGSVIMGYSYTNGFNGATAFRWTAATGMQNFGLAQGASAYAMSADASVIVGTDISNDHDYFLRAARWTSVGGWQVLSLPVYADSSEGYATSADGSVVVGYVADLLISETFHAFRWSGLPGDGGMLDLGTLHGGNDSYAYAISADGSVVVGTSDSSSGSRAFLWASSLGMVDLNTYLPSLGVNLTGWTLNSARGISADGSAIVGEGTFNGADRAFLVQGLPPLNVQAPSAPLLATFTNPKPEDSGLFGTAVAPLGNDRVLIGAEGAGTAYLFSISGTLLTTFTNPIPAGANKFGVSVAAVGSDRVLVGAYQDNTGAALAGAAYLFSTNGTLLTTFTNPTPEVGDWFGLSVTAVGSDRVLIGAHRDNTGASQAGSAYLLSTNGTLLTTFTNPTPTVGEAFGWSVAAVGNDRVLIGARFDNTGAGAAYLFRTNGALLTVFTNPAPVVADNFGVAVARVGNDLVLIGAIDSAVARNGGAAYLFRTNGTLLRTFNNPTPGAFDYFGWSVAAVGSDRVLIGAYQDYTGTARAGSAHLFSTNGTLLNTFTNPTAALDAFGVSVAAVGSDRVLIGALQDDTGATDSGAAYLFALPYPPLSIARNTNAVSISWVAAETGLILQQTDQLGMTTVWSDTTNSVSINGLTNVVQQTMATTNRFYRLRRP